MNNYFDVSKMSYIKHAISIFMAIVFSALLLPGFASAADRIVIDEWDSNGGFAPMYARVMDNMESEYIPVVFYRNTLCVRPDFDLLQLFDIPSALFCLPLSVEGFAIFEGEFDPTAGIPPIQSKFSGDSVPFAFVERSVYEEIVYDGDGLTYGELDANAIWGDASAYNEVLQPGGGPAKVPFLNIVSSGMLNTEVDADGDGDMDNTFRFQVTAQFFDSITPTARVFTLTFD
jgi:hypothetical protein